MQCDILCISNWLIYMYVLVYISKSYLRMTSVTTQSIAFINDYVQLIVLQNYNHLATFSNKKRNQ